MPNHLKEIVTELKSARATANLTLDSVDPKYRNGVEGRIRVAEREIGKLEQEYRDEVADNLLIVGLRGATSKAFAERASDSMLCIDQNMIVNLITASINDRLPNYSGFSGQELNALMGELNEIRATYGILSIPPIQDTGVAAQVASMPLDKAVDKVLQTNYGLQLHSAVIRRHAANVALEKLYDGAGRLVIGIYNFVGVDPLILPAPHVIVDLNGEITQEVVDETLEKIRQSLSGGKSANKKRSKAATKETQDVQ